MKKLSLSILLLFSFSCLFSQGFTVKKYTADITMNPDGWFDVVENYDVEFTEYKHGLLRDIITKYNLDGESRKIYISDINVPGHKFDTPPRFLVDLAGQIEIKIGDPDVTIIGPQHYEIRYRVKNAYLFKENQVMFYWNIKPDGWYADFEKVEFNVTAPTGAKLSAENSFVYSGSYGRTDPSTSFDLNYSNNTFSGKSLESSYFLGSDNITLLVKMPKEMITEVDYSPSGFIKYGWMGILGAFAFIFWAVWKKFGKDDKVIAVTSYYPPKGVDSAMAGYLINDREDASDLISLIPKWGQEGIIRVEEIPKKGIFSKGDTKIIQLQELPEDRPDYEKTIFRGLFTRIFSNDPEDGDELSSVLVSSLKDTFYTTMNAAKKELKAKAQIYYEPKSNKVMNTSYILSGLGAIVVSGIFLFVFGFLAAVVCGVFFLFLIFMSGYMKKKNSSGSEVLSEIKGFKQFVKLAETNRIKTLIESDPDYFEKTMSYALAFGLLKEWAGKFAALNIPPPEWYSSPNAVGIMSMNTFANSFSSSMNSTQSAMVSTPSSSGSGGGGSSGGGFGGGGGGSW